MSKLYIKNYDTQKVKTHLSALEEHYAKKRIKTMLYTDDGIFSVHKNEIVKLVQKDVPVVDLGGYILDKSHYVEEEVFYVPREHINVDMIELWFCIGKTSSVHLVVEGFTQNRK